MKLKLLHLTLPFAVSRFPVIPISSKEGEISAFRRLAAPTRLIRHTLLLMAMLCTTDAAHAKLVAPEEREIFRYVDRKTCYIMLTNFPPDPRDVAVKYPPTKKNAVRECEQNMASKRSDR